MCMCTLVFSVRSEPAENARYCYIIIIVIVRGRSFAPVPAAWCVVNILRRRSCGTVREAETKIIPIYPGRSITRVYIGAGCKREKRSGTYETG